MINLILCGGSGTRLWPISRTLMPKQFVKLFGGKSLFQRTVETNSQFCRLQYVISNAEQYFLAKEQLSGQRSQPPRFLLEPMGRNTAPAIALACLSLDPEALVLVSPSDHLIRDVESYAKVVLRARELAEAGNLVTFGIKPAYPETGYGYIESNGEEVRRFVEKPSIAKAQEYLEKGNYYWNSGIFCFQAGVFLEELGKYAPEMLQACNVALDSAVREGELVRVQHEEMLAIPANSIDYAVMEKSRRVKVVPASIGWSDLGSFASLHDELEREESGNTINEHHIGLDSQNCLVVGGTRKLVTIDLQNMLLVDTPDALLVAPLSSSQRVKEVVEKLKDEGSELPHVPQTVARPWGTYSVLEGADRYKIKKIVVQPGERLSLQKHYHRSEHWVVISGTATVTVGERKFLVRPNESTYIPAGELHRLQNEGRVPLAIVEVQVGEYTGEDDIVRIEDDYKR